MSAAIKAAREAAGISNNELGRLIGVEQMTVWRYETKREPDYATVGDIEHALELPRGTLFAMAGYAPTISAEAAVNLDQTLTEDQRATVLDTLAKARGLRRPKPAGLDSAAFVNTDTTISEEARQAVSGLIRAHRFVNQQKAAGSKR